jgi:hypothetical protein
MAIGLNCSDGPMLLQDDVGGLSYGMFGYTYLEKSTSRI